jgi:hypothetical protein
MREKRILDLVTHLIGQPNQDAQLFTVALDVLHNAHAHGIEAIVVSCSIALRRLTTIALLPTAIATLAQTLSNHRLYTYLFRVVVSPDAYSDSVVIRVLALLAKDCHLPSTVDAVISASGVLDGLHALLLQSQSQYHQEYLVHVLPIIGSVAKSSMCSSYNSRCCNANALISVNNNHAIVVHAIESGRAALITQGTDAVLQSFVASNTTLRIRLYAYFALIALAQNGM